VGHRFTCKKCGADLVVGSGGLEVAGADQGAGDFALVDPEGGAAPARSSRGRAGSVALQNIWERFLADSASWLFGIGVVLAVIFLFFPIIDTTKVGSYQALVTAGDQRQSRLDRELLQKKQKEPAKNYDAEDKTRKEAKEKWDEQKKELEEDVEDARTSSRRNIYWYTWGMLWGFMFLAVGALGFLKTQQTTIRRVVGAIILCAMVVLIFMVFLISSAVSSVGGGRF
jgi:hypothetical protein